jgi:hypothetical protein
VVNSLFFENGGWDIFLLDNGSNATVSSCTIIENPGAIIHGGIYNESSSPTITGCVFDGFDETGMDPIFNDPEGDEPSNPVVSYSNIEGGCDSIVDAVCGDGNIDADPLFVDLDGGDYRLANGSPCIDSGINDALPEDTFDLDEDDDTTESLPFDLDGNERIVGGTVDMGAYENQG